MLLGDCDDGQMQQDLLAGILQGFQGRRSISMPDAWPKVYAKLKAQASDTVRQSALELALIFDDPIALAALRKQASDRTAARDDRSRAVQSLVAKKVIDLAPLLLKLVRDPNTQSAALRGLAEYEHSATATTILENYHLFDATGHADAVQTLASRPSWAMALMDAVESKRVPRSDLTAYTARQLRNLRDDRITERVKTLWGEVRDTPAEKTRLIANTKRRLTPDSLTRADRSTGRAIFQKTCANCHRLFGDGGDIGPEITGAQRKNLDYMLENIIDPSATVARDYQMQVIETATGRIITGLVIAETDNAVTIQTINEKVVIPLGEIENRSVSSVSIMPDGLLQELSHQQVRELIAYLASPRQVPLKESDSKSTRAVRGSPDPAQ
jgi:putative heme-binding domain-containing protein